MMKFTVFLMVVAACISSSVALQCYVCASPKEANCEDLDTSSPKQDCGELNRIEKNNGESVVCMKSVYNSKGAKHVLRSCAKIGPTLNICALFGAPEHCSFCNKDLCNGSSPVGITNMWMTLIPAIVTVALIKYSF